VYHLFVTLHEVLYGLPSVIGLPEAQNIADRKTTPSYSLLSISKQFTVAKCDAMQGQISCLQDLQVINLTTKKHTENQYDCTKNLFQSIIL